MTGKLIIVKYGGSVLDSGSAIREAAKTIKDELERGSLMVIVVSAMKGVTDQLLSAAEEISPETPKEVIDHIIGLGEVQSVRLMASALKTIGVDAVEVTPQTPSWPIVTDDNYGDAEPILEECEIGADLGVRPLIERGRVPVICGFVGRSIDGDVTTLGRGGSDTTAVILSRCLGADELVLVKDVGGIYSADPQKVEDAFLLREISAWEANLLVSTGAKILHKKVFKYKPDELRIRLVSNCESLNGSGTVVTGTIPELDVEIHGEKVLNVTVVGDLISDAGTLASLSEMISGCGGRIMFMKASKGVTTLCLEASIEEVMRRVHSLVESKEPLKAVSSIGELALIRIRGRDLDDIGGSIKMLSDLLSGTNINLMGMVTGESSVDLLVDWEKRFEAQNLLKKSLKKKRDV